MLVVAEFIAFYEKPEPIFNPNTGETIVMDPVMFNLVVTGESQPETEITASHSVIAKNIPSAKGGFKSIVGAEGYIIVFKQIVIAWCELTGVTQPAYKETISAQSCVIIFKRIVAGSAYQEEPAGVCSKMAARFADMPSITVVCVVILKSTVTGIKKMETKPAVIAGIIFPDDQVLAMKTK